MKVVLFCGGLGTRLREHSDTVPKPLVNIGVRPIIWHLMRYYAHYGHKEFILALGYRGDMIRDYFLNYKEHLSNDFTLSQGGKKIELAHSDIQDWTIHFVDTGLHANIGQRLLRVRHYLGDDEIFLANYSDGLSNLPLDQHLAHFSQHQAVASFVSVKTSQSFHGVYADDDGTVNRLGAMSDDFRINGGFMILRRAIFDYLNEGEELVEQPFQRLIERRLLLSYRYDGFWSAMDTFKDKITYDRMEGRGDCPWKVWLKPQS